MHCAECSDHTDNQMPLLQVPSSGGDAQTAAAVSAADATVHPGSHASAQPTGSNSVAQSFKVTGDALQRIAELKKKVADARGRWPKHTENGKLPNGLLVLLYREIVARHGRC